jgi:hypothetical protein
MHLGVYLKEAQKPTLSRRQGTGQADQASTTALGPQIGPDKPRKQLLARGGTQDESTIDP